ncbi:hypothetical protein BO70DRAFT_163271 [Aspergillus heteromorphus CBS 117.55]|uniref:Uncharacterized protein n=1 Tax=Aspergillus heteromorphus CBS 117.55 TaxID=1448321 RepID=A0A317WWN7_9EURO|nr:uncharacterized protein BO70DRAFT_163271 [Aspergillus heteromorphus CBS 117.55]PWY89228.1 hypothetical protein BO70DRAFT_163271 [Aspergillus heteromorphus CBS 117.55]
MAEGPIHPLRLLERAHNSPLQGKCVSTCRGVYASLFIAFLSICSLWKVVQRTSADVSVGGAFPVVDVNRGERWSTMNKNSPLVLHVR